MKVHFEGNTVTVEAPLGSDTREMKQLAGLSVVKHCRTTGENYSTKLGKSVIVKSEGSKVIRWSMYKLSDWSAR